MKTKTWQAANGGKRDTSKPAGHQEKTVLERMSYNYWLLLSYQSTEREIREMPWTAKYLNLLEQELKALRNNHIEIADKLRNLINGHEELLG